MKFNKNILAVATIAFVPMFANALPTVTFQGEVTDQTCQASINGGTEGVVLLPTVAATELAAAGNTAGLTTFSINVTGCTANATEDVQIKTKFLGHNVTTGGALGNVAKGSNAATNVAIQLTKDAAGVTPVVLNGATAVSGLVLKATQTAASYDFAARYISEAGSATAGMVTSVVEYTLSYQ